MNEFELIQQFFSGDPRAPGVELGVGDDCALLQIPQGQLLAVSVDTLVGDVHFPSQADPELIAERALRVTVSDLAAMGAEPLWYTLALTLPDADPHWLESFSFGLGAAASDFDIALVGGDTTRGPLTITLQVYGCLPPGGALRRDGAGLGDIVFVSGSLGDSAAALAAMKKELVVGGDDSAYLQERYYKPESQIAIGKALRGIASAAIDISDGLLQDLGHICRASDVAAVIEYERLPLSSVLRGSASEAQAISWPLAGGDDYRLCFTVPRDRLDAFENIADRYSFDLTAIGEIVAGTGVTCLKDGQVVKLAAGQGFQHFR